MDTRFTSADHDDTLTDWQRDRVTAQRLKLAIGRGYISRDEAERVWYRIPRVRRLADM